MTSKAPIEVVKDWWGIVVIVLAIFGGYFWLDKNYARIDKLATEKCILSYEIQLTRVDIDFQRIDEEIRLQRNEYEKLLQLLDPPLKIKEFKFNYIQKLDERLLEIDKLKKCLTRHRNKCFEGKVDTDQCL